MKRISQIFLFLSWITLLGSESLHAYTIVVTEASSAALQNAINRAQRGDVITFDPAINPDFTVSSDIFIKTSLTIKGRDDGKTTIRGNNCPIFTIQVKESVELVNLTLRDGVARGEDGESLGTGGGGGGGAGGAVLFSGINLRCDHVRFINNRAAGGNGGGTMALSNGGKGGSGSHRYKNGGEGGRGGLHTPDGKAGGDLSGGGGGSGEWFLVCNGSPGGNGGYGAGGGGGGGGGITWGNGGTAGRFGGVGGGGGLFCTNGGGGGGAGLGGAIFCFSGNLILENCEFSGNTATGGSSGTNAGSGQGKGGAICVKEAKIGVYNTTFSTNSASSSGGSGFVSGTQNDTSDVYGYLTSFVPLTTSPKSIIVTSALDECFGQAVGTGVSLREALHYVADGGEIIIPNKKSSASLTINPNNGPIVIEKNVKIKGPGKDRFAIDGNNASVFFVKSGHLYLDNIKIINASAIGGNGGDGFLTDYGGGGAAGMGGAVFVNSNAVLTSVNCHYENCLAQGGNGGKGGAYTFYLGGGGGGISGPGGSAWDIFDESNKRYGGLGGSGWPLDGLDGKGGAGAGPNLLYPDNGGFGGGGGGGNNGDLERSGNFGKGGFAGGGGGFGGNLPRVPGGQFGGAATNINGGGGAGLGGAIFVREMGTAILDQCIFNGNAAKAGTGSSDGTAYAAQGKACSVFVMDKAIAKVRNCVFNGKSTANTGEIDGFAYNMSVDIPDIYGVLNELSDSDISAFPDVDTPVAFWHLYEKATSH